ncbi:MAG: ABC transporter substrate-binding protein [Thermomicrobiales bacterium]
MVKLLTRRETLKGAGAGLAGAAMLGPAGRTALARQDTEPVTITFWHYYGGGTTVALEGLLQRYMDEHPGVTIEPRLINFSDFNRTLLQGAAAGDLPDIALINCFDTQLFAESGIIEDLTERVTAWGGAEEYWPGVYETSLWDGQNYGLPHLVDCYVLWYNVDQFTDAGVEPPPTWEELSTVAAALSGDNRYGLAVSAIEGAEGATAWIIRLLATGTPVTEVNSDGGKEALGQFVDLVESGSMSPGILGWIEDDVATQFSTGQAGMMINSATYVNFFRQEAPDLNWSLAVLPEDVERSTFLSAENLTITTGAQQPDAAWDLMLWMQQPEVLNEYLPERNKLPALANVAAEPQWADDPVWSVFIEQLSSAWAPTGDVAIHSAEIFTFIQEAVQAAISGDSSVDDALAATQAKIDEVLAG